MGSQSNLPLLCLGSCTYSKQEYPLLTYRTRIEPYEIARSRSSQSRFTREIIIPPVLIKNNGTSQAFVLIVDCSPSYSVITVPAVLAMSQENRKESQARGPSSTGASSEAELAQVSAPQRSAPGFLSLSEPLRLSLCRSPSRFAATFLGLRPDIRGVGA